MKLFNTIFFLTFSLLSGLYSQNQPIPEHYKVTLSEKPYFLKNCKVTYAGMTLTLEKFEVQLLITDQGITGMVGTGKGFISFNANSKEKSYSDTITRIFIRFNPADFKELTFIDNAAPTDNTIISTNIFEFYSQSFRRMYHVGPDAIIPENGDLGVRVLTSSGQIMQYWNSKNGNDIGLFINNNRIY